ncbi:hypothetical protein G4X40_20310 [Rhodococcus sp. D2-41]|uniref:hypothetical protein n=1 Tax=Speluncibacter jeojiensis TaxID=2710754 RepID=UPI00240ED2D2|nr:hypothetical protein [Rhodococcus sp. D2-41]MDG3012487.1 hypothetical protein [Rhodococcus sp. D2-41]
MAGQCRDCGSPVRWVLTSGRGTRVPIDLSPDSDHGTARVFSAPHPATGREALWAELLTGDRLTAAHADGEMLFMLHARTCTAHKPHNPRPAHIRLDLPARARR